MEEYEDYTKIPLTDENGCPDRSGCGPIAATLLIIALFWAAVICVKMFT